MVLDTTYTNKEVTKSINQALGTPFGFWERIRLGGIGSHRIKIHHADDELAQYINPGLSANYLNMELRKKGILVHLKRRTQTYAWIIPYNQLQFDDQYACVSDGKYAIALENASQHNASFFYKLERLKVR